MIIHASTRYRPAPLPSMSREGYRAFVERLLEEPIVGMGDQVDPPDLVYGGFDIYTDPRIPRDTIAAINTQMIAELRARYATREITFVNITLV